MGNWRTVDMVGSIDENDVESIIKYLSVPKWDSPEYTEWERNFDDDCFCFSIMKSMCGLNCWINDGGSIDVSANLSERDYDNDDIEKALKRLAGLYPSLELTLHSGSDYEELDCTATFHVKDGVVERCSPEIDQIRPCRMMPISYFF